MLTSATNPLVKRLALLHAAPGRRAQGLLLVEGERAIAACLAGGWQPAHLLVRSDLQAPPGWPAVTPVSERIIARLSQARTPSGWLAAFPLPTPPALDPAAGGLVLHEVQDPGNVGTLVRTAAAFGVGQVVLVGGADPYGAKAVQASAGSLAQVHLHVAAALPEALAHGAPRCALVARGGIAPEAAVRRRRWLLIGAEAHGLPDALVASAEERVTLPMPGAVESLNAAIAGAIATYLLLRP